MLLKMLLKTKSYINSIRKLSFKTKNDVKNYLIKNNFLEIGEEVADSNQPIVALESSLNYN
jgi:hypothetical protein